MRGDIQDRARRALRERERRAALKAGGVKRERTDEERARHAEQERERRKIQSPETKRRSVEWHRKDREKNRERYRAYQRDFQRKRRAKMIADGLNPNNPREAQNRYSAAFRARNPKKILLHGAKYGSLKRGIEFALTMEDLVWPTHCPVLGLELDYSGSGPKYKRANAPSLDRWDNSKGYVPGNVFVISWRANWLKHDGSIEELRRVADYAANGLSLAA